MSPLIQDKPVQIRPWKLSDADFVLDASLPLDPRKTVFVGGVPRPLKAGKASALLSICASSPDDRCEPIDEDWSIIQYFFVSLALSLSRGSAVIDRADFQWNWL